MDSETFSFVFMGTPGYAVPVLEALVRAGHRILAVYTQPDRPAGRGKRPLEPEVKRSAMEHGLIVSQPASLRKDEAAQEELVSLRPDVVVVAAYGLLLPSAVLDAPRLGSLNVHPSLLPRYRGASPVSTAILNGDPITGVTIMEIDEGMDSGPVVDQREVPIGEDENAENLTLRLFREGAEMMAAILPRWARGETRSQPQDYSRATVTRRLSKDDGRIDWTQSAEYIARQVRAYHPWPGTFSQWRGKLVKVIEASATTAGQAPEPPGTVIHLPGDRTGVATGSGALELRQLQLEGRRATTAQEFVSGRPGFFGSTLASGH